MALRNSPGALRCQLPTIRRPQSRAVSRAAPGGKRGLWPLAPFYQGRWAPARGLGTLSAIWVPRGPS